MDAGASVPLTLSQNREEVEFMLLELNVCVLCLFLVYLSTSGHSGWKQQRGNALSRGLLRNVMQEILVLNDFVPSKDVDMTSFQRFSTFFFFNLVW